jgi:threonine synthase
MLDVSYLGRATLPSLPGSFWDYEQLLPRGRYRHFEVGSTRLIPARERGLFLKMELENPTKSFKDRGSVVEVAKAREYRYREVVCASTGNMAYSIAYYAKLYGMRATVFIGGKANKDKLRDIRETRDATTIRVNGDFTKAQGLAEAYARKHNAFLAGDYCYRQEGQSTMAYEILEQAPDAKYVIVPVGNATLISVVLKAFSSIKDADQKAHVPRVIGVESSSCNPLEEAFRLDKQAGYQTPRTKADAIAVGLPTFADTALKYLHSMDGSMVAVTDKEMEREQKLFYEEYGIIAELAGVASMAAYRKLGIGGSEKTVAIISGGNA